MPFTFTLVAVFFPLIALITLSCIAYVSEHIAPQFTPAHAGQRPAQHKRRAPIHR
ncbi:hypothetical protein [Litorivita pollutaquae]|uniref:hypothetical protein n=1 Tax=Litorivita pollutaquae TaxID=2200892 RepID=UPI0013A5F689|nr:hypothetical protein [Litorivita pollutaquae]